MQSIGTKDSTYFFLERTFWVSGEEIVERRQEIRKNDHHNPAGNRTQDLSLSGRLLYRLSYWARSDSDQITEPLSPSPAERMSSDPHFHQNPLMSLGAQPSGIPQTREGRCLGENIFREHPGWVQNKYLHKERRNRMTTGERNKWPPQHNYYNRVRGWVLSWNRLSIMPPAAGFQDPNYAQHALRYETRHSAGCCCKTLSALSFPWGDGLQPSQLCPLVSLALGLSSFWGICCSILADKHWDFRPSYVCIQQHVNWYTVELLVVGKTSFACPENALFFLWKLP